VIDEPDVPALAIAAFERMSGLAISLHDPGRNLWTRLDPDRFEHLNPLCRSVKAVRQPACTAFDATLVHEQAAERWEGFVKVCHAGFVEWVVPLIADGATQWILFAGVRRPAPGLERILADPSPLLRGGPWNAQLAKLPAVDDGEAAWILESLRQLNQRLSAWRAGQAPGTPMELPRSTLIHRHLVARHADPDFRLAELAQVLGLSESRAGHVVREACGRTFVDLLTEVRLRTAAGLLRHTGLPLDGVVAASGFGNLSHFHQVFRRTFGVSPGKYRTRTS
jgi:AraC-like DNA-binding protein